MGFPFHLFGGKAWQICLGYQLTLWSTHSPTPIAWRSRPSTAWHRKFLRFCMPARIRGSTSSTRKVQIAHAQYRTVYDRLKYPCITVNVYIGVRHRHCKIASANRSETLALTPRTLPQGSRMDVKSTCPIGQMGLSASPGGTKPEASQEIWTCNSDSCLQYSWGSANGQVVSSIASQRYSKVKMVKWNE